MPGRVASGGTLAAKKRSKYNCEHSSQNNMQRFQSKPSPLLPHSNNRLTVHRMVVGHRRRPEQVSLRATRPSFLFHILYSSITRMYCGGEYITATTPPSTPIFAGSKLFPWILLTVRGTNLDLNFKTGSCLFWNLKTSDTKNIYCKFLIGKRHLISEPPLPEWYNERLPLQRSLLGSTLLVSVPLT